jgi:hypothetical protein
MQSVSRNPPVSEFNFIKPVKTRSQTQKRIPSAPKIRTKRRPKKRKKSAITL